MRWWGKLFGGVFGYLLLGPFGILIGVVLGHCFDFGFDRFRDKLQKIRRYTVSGTRDQAQLAFFTAIFSVLGHLSKADGRVSESEIRLAQAVMEQMRLNAAMHEQAKSLFRAGKQAGFNLDDTLDRFKRECRPGPQMLSAFVGTLLQSAYADGPLHPEERRILLHVSDRLGLSRREFVRLDAFVGGATGQPGARGARSPAVESDLSRAYRILDVSPAADNAEIKKAYRRFLSQYHPDKLVARGLPEGMMKLASEKTVEIRKAYEKIREARGF